MRTTEYKSIQDWMERTGTHQAELARRAQIPRSVLSMLLSGSRRCSLGSAFKLAKVTGVPVEKLVKWPKVPLKRSFLEVVSN